MGPEKVRSWQAATLIALLANVHRDPRKSRKYRAGDFDPYDTKPRRTGTKITRENWDWFVKAFTQGGRRCSG